MYCAKNTNNLYQSKEGAHFFRIPVNSQPLPTFFSNSLFRNGRRKWTARNSLSDNQVFPSACNARAINHHFALSPVCIPTCRKLQLPPCAGLHSKRIAKRARPRLTRIYGERNVAVKGSECLSSSARAFAFRGKWIDVLRACLRRRET